MTPIQEALKNLPEDPGVYIYHDSQKQVIYVGKAINLKNRVKSYFQKSSQLGPKTQALVANIAFIEMIKVESEIEALLLEAELIKRYKPRYNIVLKDDKSPLYIKITTDEEIPRITTARREQLPEVTYFGPYPSAQTAKRVLRIIRKIFPYRSCKTLPDRPCLYYHLHLCKAPCIGHISPVDYQATVKDIILFLQGKKRSLLKKLEQRMKEFSAELRFEDAAIIKSQIDNIIYVTTTHKNPLDYIDNPNLIEDERQKTLEELANALKPYLNIDPPSRIECYDISNFQGKEAVGAMTVATDGQLDKSQYRKFKIRTKDTPDDFSMMKETLKRRIKHQEWGIPDLIVIDGGKGQLSAAHEVLDSAPIHYNVISIAKRFEELWMRDSSGDFQVVNLPRSSSALQLIQRLRDEAHRFGITYHRLLRSKKQKAG